MTRAALAAAVQSVGGQAAVPARRVSPDGRVEQASGPSSHLVAGMARSDVLIDIPADVERLAAGADVTVWTL